MVGGRGLPDSQEARHCQLPPLPTTRPLSAIENETTATSLCGDAAAQDRPQAGPGGQDRLSVSGACRLGCLQPHIFNKEDWVAGGASTKPRQGCLLLPGVLTGLGEAGSLVALSDRPHVEA